MWLAAAPALDKLLPMQRGDFEEIFRILEDRPATIRLLDPPLHEFLPHTDEDMEDVAKASGVSVEELKRRAGRICTKAILCSAIAVAAWALHIPKSTRCRRAPSSRRLSNGGQ
jgi:phosphoenolpyruvate synthase/pyruvate phosphate dikinase